MIDAKTGWFPCTFVYRRSVGDGYIETDTETQEIRFSDNFGNIASFPVLETGNLIRALTEIEGGPPE